MKTNLVITVMADDKPGLVESLSQTISSNSGNWLESSMSQLAGKFAGILRVSVENDKADKLVEDLKGLFLFGRMIFGLVITLNLTKLKLP